VENGDMLESWHDILKSQKNLLLNMQYVSDVRQIEIHTALKSVYDPAPHEVYIVRFEVFTVVTMKNGVFWDVTPCSSCKNRRFGGT
jgi:hypothetical protein